MFCDIFIRYLFNPIVYFLPLELFLSIYVGHVVNFSASRGLLLLEERPNLFKNKNCEGKGAISCIFLHLFVH